MKYGHLERLEITLHTLAPVFIGSGESLTKKEYIFDPKAGKIHMPDLARLTAFLSGRKLLPAFESYLLHPRNNDLLKFLSDNGIGQKDYPSFVAYTIDAGEAAYSTHFRNILTFIKDATGQPYIPGSSLKGVLRTAIAAKLIAKGNFQRNIDAIEQGADNFKNSRSYLDREDKMLNRILFCRLNITDPQRPDMVNDFMRGIIISDSEPIAFENLTLCGKYDRKPSGETKQLPIFRECLAPGTKTRFVLTLNKPVLARVGIDKDYLEEALHSFADMHNTHFEQFFAALPEDAKVRAENGVDIILGGGSGYVPKTIIYPLFADRNRALKTVAKIMTKQFPRHKHDKDIGVFKVSPHTMKTTMYKGAYYQIGRCELIFH
jgi:CRISPR-associated protein Csm5